MSTKSERACMLCGIIQPMKKFKAIGCPNCESLLHFASDSAQIAECTSPSFEGLVALGQDNKGSWVARWLRIDSFVPGLYAVKVNGKLPLDVVDSLERADVYYRPRDGTAED
ncbi:transcription elongation factor spt4 [Lodderomyces elongisporus]|uniref:Transcription elongation factor SPT4 n=1 Tax=Lodderomyces elongisporus (strain ATCC 11503 / CBS 2605 / JCM 1781 / NBRC 1676 / NRRL YB-4239) TaxID=379508 RepID=A5E337_LODEL|nr:transcription elongation factor spt4 [Lodderomyces elongisporus]EDK45845.1 transcription elongation factor SPT4 [Lodderomyces elongisporus NRRL YB-4239]WLF81051.1 transcription elongation factor spt4 [Lodderomyces elongisporus]